MKAIVCNKYGPVSDLQLQEVPKPEPESKEVLIKVIATAINDYDWSMVRGKPYLYRLMYGIFKPKIRIPGMELAGIIEEVGREVTDFARGDKVYGDTSDFGFGSLAEYMCIDSKAVRKKPESMSFEVAAALPHASLLAWQALVDLGELQKNQKVLLNGAGGGVGTIGLQICKTFGCEVTGVDTGSKLKMMQELGFDRVIDYKEENFTKAGEQFDLIVDCKTSHTPFAYPRVLKPGGTYITVGGKVGRLLQLFLFGKMLKIFTGRTLKILALKPNKGLEHIEHLFLKGQIECIIDGPYPLAETATHLHRFGTGKHQGKVVLKP
ncbi:MAG: NAD(P)-dependent alcohol dehydrogenase [Flavobacteriaceae bacterium]